MLVPFLFHILTILFCYLPHGIFLVRLLMCVADLVAASLLGNSWMAAVISRQTILGVLAGALVDATMRVTITLELVFSILCAMM